MSGIYKAQWLQIGYCWRGAWHAHPGRLTVLIETYFFFSFKKKISSVSFNQDCWLYFWTARMCALSTTWYPGLLILGSNYYPIFFLHSLSSSPIITLIFLSIPPQPLPYFQSLLYFFLHLLLTTKLQLFAPFSFTEMKIFNYGNTPTPIHTRYLRHNSFPPLSASQSNLLPRKSLNHHQV